MQRRKTLLASMLVVLAIGLLPGLAVAETTGGSTSSGSGAALESQAEAAYPWEDGFLGKWSELGNIETTRYQVSLAGAEEFWLKFETPKAGYYRVYSDKGNGEGSFNVHLFLSGNENPLGSCTSNSGDGSFSLTKELQKGTYYLRFSNKSENDDASCWVAVEQSSGATAKAANPMTVKAKTVKAKAKKKTIIKKAKAFTVKKAQGKVTFKKTSGNKKITVSKAGNVTVKKGLKKGKTYKVKVKVKAAGNDNYKSAAKTVTLKVKVN
ncbi:MAG: hypothetical protein Q3963_03810 [Coriobacteriaceae bacterium]|nr:hypothetical protein [Coriobacteriaceae bacterium]